MSYPSPAAPGAGRRRAALRFVVLIGILSFFADFTYEGSRSILGPYLAVLGASATAVAVVTGFGELLGYGLRLVSGRAADRTRQFWPITIFGYVVQMLAVPLLAVAPSWPAAAALIMLERAGKAIRNPPRDVMLSHAAREIGYGWAFGVHEGLDQAGALVGPLVVAAMLVLSGDYRRAFAALLVPGLVCLAFLMVARWLYPRPEDLEAGLPQIRTGGLPRIFWWYLAGAALVAAGFADYPLIAYHFARTASVDPSWIPVLYAVAMGVGAVASPVMGRLYDRRGLSVLAPLTVVTALFAPLVFSGGFSGALAGAALWGLGIGVHESVVPAAVAPMVPADRRASAYGLFTAGYGLSWFLGSAVIGVLYDRSVPAAIAFCVAVELAAALVFVLVGRRQRLGWRPA